MTALEFTFHLGKVSKSLKPFAMKLTRDYEEANDLLQDTLLKAFTNRDKYTEGTNLNSTNNEAISSFAMNDINNAVGSLEDAYKTPFMMHYRGFKYHEIAEKLEIPIGTVKNRIHIARKELKDRLHMYAYSN